MPTNQPASSYLSLFNLDRSAPLPLHRQIYDGIRQAVLNKRLKAGSRLPSTRELAASLSVSRNTVMNAFDQLLAEGYLEAQVGAGTFVSEQMPQELLRSDKQEVEETAVSPEQERPLSQRGRNYRQIFTDYFQRSPRQQFATFPISTPDLSLFPFDTWARLMARQQKFNLEKTFARSGDIAGYLPLREAITDHLKLSRAVQCRPEQIFITAGSQQALYLAGQVLLDQGDPVWVEDPGYLGVRSALFGAGARLTPVSVDDEGLNVATAMKCNPVAKMAHVTPSHQFPLGHTMSLARRGKLLDWAARHDAWVLEDDYDSEYRYGGFPLASLQGLDARQRVIYVGTFSKVLFPGLRVGYMVVPPDLIGAFTVARAAMDMHPPLLSQLVLTDFINEGHLARHLRRTRVQYEQRRACLIAALDKELGQAIERIPSDTGMHLTVWLPEGVSDQMVSARAYANRVTATPLSLLAMEPLPRGGLVLGFSNSDCLQIEAGVKRLAQVLRDCE